MTLEIKLVQPGSCFIIPTGYPDWKNVLVLVT